MEWPWVRHVLDVIGSKGARYAELGTSDTSPGPMALYRSCGFYVTGTIKNHFTDNYPEPVWDNGVQCIDMIRMRRILPIGSERINQADSGHPAVAFHQNFSIRTVHSMRPSPQPVQSHKGLHKHVPEKAVTGRYPEI